ncbi:MAG TPA: SH3 domain-containing protein [Rudaea sp.]|jgi:uncharacterized protein YraI|nr:SH3 domain-containing protein [Rudaea sp.]
MKRVLGFAIALALGAPLAALANDAYVVSDISLQSGPDTDYPPIDNLSAGTEVDVQGCVEGFSWCDVIVGEDRGWVPGSFIEEEYDNQPEFLVDYGPRIGVPIVSFNIGVYWDAHYHNRPFYGQRTEWVNRHIAVRAPPRPSIAHAPPIPHRGDNRGAPVAHPQPAHTVAKPSVQHTPVRDEHAQTPREETTNRTTRERTAIAPKPQVAPPKPEERAKTIERTPPKTAEHTPPKQVERAQPKAKEEPKKEEKQPEHKDDDHGH